MCIRWQCQIQCLPRSKAESSTDNRVILVAYFTPWGDYLICEVINKRRAVQRLYDLIYLVLTCIIAIYFYLGAFSRRSFFGSWRFCFSESWDIVTGIARHQSVARFAYEHEVIQKSWICIWCRIPAGRLCT